MQLQPASTPQESQRRTLRYHLAPGLELGPQQFKRIYTDKRHGVPFVSSRDMFFLPLRPERFLSRRMLKLEDLNGAGRLATAEQVGDGRQCALREPKSCGVRHIGPCHSH